MKQKPGTAELGEMKFLKLWEGEFVRAQVERRVESDGKVAYTIQFRDNDGDFFPKSGMLRNLEIIPVDDVMPQNLRMDSPDDVKVPKDDVFSKMPFGGFLRYLTTVFLGIPFVIVFMLLLLAVFATPVALVGWLIYLAVV